MDSGGWIGGSRLPVSEWQLVIPDLIPLDGPWEFGEGETFPNSSALKTGLWELGPRPDLPRTPAGPSPQ